MYDRPSLSELLDAVRLHLEGAVIPAVRADRRLYFQTLVAVNVLKIAMRELGLAPAHAASEWAGLNALEGVETPAPAALTELNAAIAGRNRALCAAIRAGDYDDPDRRAVLFAHVMATTRAQLEVANPRLLDMTS
jgi:hypothetical protein